MRLANKVALITGAGRGIGKQTALAFAREGADVVLFARTQAQLDALAQKIESSGRRALAVAGDVADEADVSRMVDRAIQLFERIDIMVNSAGIGGPVGTVADTPVEDWDRTIAINLRGVFLVCRTVMPVMIHQGSGKVINVASTSGLRGFPKLAAYCSSKFAVVGLTQCLAREAAEHGISVNALCPGPTETSMAAEHWPLIAKYEGMTVDALRTQIIEHTPQKRILPPQEVAAAAVFLASDESSGITGTELVVSGGFAGA